MPKSKYKLQNQELDINQERPRKLENKKNYTSLEIDSVEKNTGGENPKDEDKNFSKIHTQPADEQQFEDNLLDPDNKK